MLSCSTTENIATETSTFVLELNDQYEVNNKISIYTPFYDSDNNLIKTGDIETLLKVESQMFENMDSVPIETMYVLAASMYNNGYKDKATYWFYTAQLYSMVFYEVMDKSSYGMIGNYTFELASGFNAFNELAGQWINGFAFGDVDKLTFILEDILTNDRVLQYEILYPEAEYSALENKEAIHISKRDGLSGFIEYLTKNKEEIYKTREENGISGIY